MTAPASPPTSGAPQGGPVHQLSDRKLLGLIYRKIKISFLQHLGPRGTSSAHRPTELVGNDRDARRCRAGGCIDTDSSACPHPPTPKSLRDTRRDRPPPFTRSFAKFD